MFYRLGLGRAQGLGHTSLSETLRAPPPPLGATRRVALHSAQHRDDIDGRGAHMRLGKPGGAPAA